MILYGKIEKNILSFENAELLKIAVKELNDQDVQIEIKKRSKKYTVNQNNYFHLVVSRFCKSEGWDEEGLKLDLKDMFGKKESRINLITMDEYDYLYSTSDYKKDDFIKLINGTLFWIKHNHPDFKIPDIDLYHLKEEDFISELIK